VRGRKVMEEKRRCGAPPKGTLIGPLLMLVCGAATGLVLWRFLMLEPAAPPSDAGRLTHHDRRTIGKLLNERIERP
jgi:hypothetical protein